MLDAGLTYSDVDHGVACFLGEERVSRSVFTMFGTEGAPVSEVDNPSGLCKAVQSIRGGQATCVLVIGLRPRQVQQCRIQGDSGTRTHIGKIPDIACLSQGLVNANSSLLDVIASGFADMWSKQLWHCRSNDNNISQAGSAGCKGYTDRGTASLRFWRKSSFGRLEICETAKSIRITGTFRRNVRSGCTLRSSLATSRMGVQPAGDASSEHSAVHFKFSRRSERGNLGAFRWPRSIAMG